MTKQIKIYFKFVPENKLLYDESTELAKTNWLKYNTVNNKNTSYISYLMKKQFSGPHEIKYNQHKKPIIDHGFFNISHDKNLCVGVFHDECDIGIDVIHVHRIMNSRLFKKLFNHDEPNNIFQFSRKEAYIKMIGKTVFNTKLLSDIKIIDGVIYYKDKIEPYDIFETFFNDYFICIVGKFNPTQFIFKEFEIQ
jgi:hypothetical protein